MMYKRWSWPVLSRPVSLYLSEDEKIRKWNDHVDGSGNKRLIKIVRDSRPMGKRNPQKKKKLLNDSGSNFSESLWCVQENMRCRLHEIRGSKRPKHRSRGSSSLLPIYCVHPIVNFIVWNQYCVHLGYGNN